MPLCIMQEDRNRPVSRLRLWIQRHPLFVAAMWIVLAYVLSQTLAMGFPIALLLALIAGRVLFGYKTALVWALLIGLAMGLGSWRTSQERRVLAVLVQAASAEYSGRLLAEPRAKDGFWQAPVRLDGWHVKVWWQGRGKAPVEGSRVRAHGRFELAQAPRNPGEFDRRQWMSQQGMLAIFRQQPHGSGKLEIGFWPGVLADARARVRHAIGHGLDGQSDGAKVIRAVVLGDKPADDRRLMEDFRYSGSMHVFSVSGLHVGMVAVLVWLVAAWTGFGRRWLVLPVIILVFAYALLTGANAPAVRAAWMAAVFLGAFCFRRRPDLSNALGAVLLVLLIWDVRQLNQPSVQLSYGVVSAIAFGMPWTTRWFSGLGAAPMLMPVAEIRGFRLYWWRLRQWLASTLAVSSAAGIGAAPLTLWHFGLVTPVSVIAALLMLPLVFLVIALAMFSILLSPLELATGPVMTLTNRVNGLLATGCAKAAALMADLPAGHWQLNRERGPVLWVFDLKYGDGAAVWLPQRGGAASLIDCGGRHSFRHPLVSSLERLGLKPDSVVLTHPDGGHVGGGQLVWRELPITQALLPVEKARSPAYRTWIEQAPAEGVSLIQASQLQTLPMGNGARIEWLHIPDPLDQNLAADHRVLVMRLHWRGWKVLWLGDAGFATEQIMLDSARDLQADVIVCGSHRSDLSMGDDFVEAVGPRVIILDSDSHADEVRRNSLQVQHWRKAGITVFEQSACGAVSLRPEDGSLLIEAFLNGQVVRLEQVANAR